MEVFSAIIFRNSGKLSLQMLTQDSITVFEEEIRLDRERDFLKLHDRGGLPPKRWEDLNFEKVNFWWEKVVLNNMGGSDNGNQKRG